MTSFIGTYKADFNVINIAKYGYTSAKLLPAGDTARNITKALTYNPLLIIINIPSNDIAEGISPQVMIANLSTIKQQAEAAGVRVLITTTQPRDFATLAERQVLQTTANTMLSTFGAAAIDVYTPLVNAADLKIRTTYNVDGVHLNNAGHGVLYQTIRPKVEYILNKTQLEFTTTNAPSFIDATALGDGRGRLTIKPGFGQKGTYNNVMVSVVDKNGNYSNQLLNVVVDEVDEAPDPDKLLKPLYNGLISAASWRTESPSGGTPLTGMYRYEYDSSYQIKNAEWGNPNFQDNRFERQGNRYRLAGMRYDANGNIQALHRYDAQGYHTDVFAYHYAAHKNQLLDVTGYTSNSNAQQHGFAYNRIGQMVMADKLTGEDQFVEYDVTGKVKAVYRDAGKTMPRIRNYYSDRGFRLAKVAYPEQAGGDTLTTWYVHDASGTVLSIYEQEGAPDLKNVHAVHEKEIPVYGSGKLGTFYPLQDASMAYEITDHLGNVRALIRDNVNVYVATMEDSEVEDTTNPRVEEMQYFENLFGTAVEDARMNHTPPVPGREENPDKAAYLYWVDGTPGMTAADKAVGPSIALKVKPGDKISLKTWARYEEQEDYTSDVTLALFAQFLGTDLTAMPGLDGAPVSNPTGALESALGMFPGEGEDAAQLRAFLNYIVFDENMVGVAAHRVQVSDLAGFDAGEIATPAGLEELQDSVEITTNGYIYVWVSNGSEGTKVWFDDLTVVHTAGVVTQATDYGVWGDVLREEKLDETKYRFGYQGQFAENDEETGWSHFELREYDPIIGRWFVPDPAREFPSPYVAFGNDPINKIDPDGGCTGDCPGADIVNEPFSVGFSSYSYNKHAAEREARLEPGILASSWQATKDFGGDLFSGRLFSNAWKSVSDYVTDYPNSMLKNLDYQLKLGQGEIPANQIAYDATYAFLSAATVRGAVGATGATFSYTGRAFGPLKQWIRIGPSYSHYLGQDIRLSIRWGASPGQNWKYVKLIGSPTLRMVNQGLRQMKFPGFGWRFKDAGHLHLKK